MNMKTSMEGTRSYGRLALMIVLSYISMYALMYAMVDVTANIYPNLNQFYMAGLMSVPMVLIELWLMRMMYRDTRLNALIITASIVAFVACWVGVRQQVGISDTQFLKSMIPHHASAILMCEQASLQDPDLKELCAHIMTGQQSEIDQMKAKLQELDK